MQSEAVFENIADRILLEIDKAKSSIYIAVAWFTNKNIFNKLLEKTNAGCEVHLAISKDALNLNNSINFNLLKNSNSKCFWIGNGETELMHNKFCVIDFSTVITGSYNWSYKAESNFENVVINSDDVVLATQFVEEFNQIIKQYYPDAHKSANIFPLDKVI